jgi:hypothetical protein
MNNMIEFVIDHGMTVASSKVSNADLACGVLGALRRVRGVVQEVGDPNALSVLDGGLRDRQMESLNGAPELSDLITQLTLNEESYADAARSDGSKLAYLN